MSGKLTISELTDKVIYHEKKANYYLDKLRERQRKYRLIGFNYKTIKTDDRYKHIRKV